MLDGDAVNACGKAMLSAEGVWDYLKEDFIPFISEEKDKQIEEAYERGNANGFASAMRTKEEWQEEERSKTIAECVEIIIDEFEELMTLFHPDNSGQKVLKSEDAILKRLSSLTENKETNEQ